MSFFTVNVTFSVLWSREDKVSGGTSIIKAVCEDIAKINTGGLQPLGLLTVS